MLGRNETGKPILEKHGQQPPSHHVPPPTVADSETFRDRGSHPIHLESARPLETRSQLLFLCGAGCLVLPLRLHSGGSKNSQG